METVCKAHLALQQSCLVENDDLIGYNEEVTKTKDSLRPHESNIDHEGKSLAGVTGHRFEDSSTQIVLVMGG